jgi:hypothetical protein
MSDEDQQKAIEDGIIRLKKFEKELTSLINAHGIDGFANIPDFIIAKHLISHLAVVSDMVQRLDEFFNSHKKDSRKPEKGN